MGEGGERELMRGKGFWRRTQALKSNWDQILVVPLFLKQVTDP